MSDRRPTLDELVGDDVPAAERERLQRVHELLLAAGPPPELPPSLAVAPSEPRAHVIPFPRRYRFTAAAAAAAVALALLGGGYVIGRASGSQDAERTIAMRGPTGATAQLAVFAKDAAGNWPMSLRVRGLRAGATYELWLTRDGKLAESCGSFAVAAGTTEVPLNAPYRLKEYDDWVVVEAGSTEPVLTTSPA